MMFRNKTQPFHCCRSRNWLRILDFIRPAATILLIISLTGCASINTVLNSGAVRSGPDGRPVVDISVVRQLSQTDCGAACLAFTLTHWGGDYTIKSIEAQLPPPGKYGYSLAQMQSFVNSQGMKAFLFSGTMDDLLKHTSLGRPCIIVYKVNKHENHAVVVTELIDDGKGEYKVVVMDPNKKRTISIEKMWIEPRWQAIGSPLLLIGRQEKGVARE